jgi:hypothetical protein
VLSPSRRLMRWAYISLFDEPASAMGRIARTASFEKLSRKRLAERCNVSPDLSQGPNPFGKGNPQDLDENGDEPDSRLVR